MAEKQILQIPLLRLFSSHIFTHESKGVHEAIMVYRLSLRNKFINQNSVNNEVAFTLKKLFSPYVGMEMRTLQLRWLLLCFLATPINPGLISTCYHLRKKFWFSFQSLLNVLKCFNKILLLLLTQLVGHEIGSDVHIVFQNALTDPNKIPNMVATANCRKIFCGLKNRIFLKTNRLGQNMLGRRKKSVAFSIESLCFFPVIPALHSVLQNCALYLASYMTGGKLQNMCKILHYKITRYTVCSGGEGRKKREREREGGHYFIWQPLAATSSHLNYYINTTLSVNCPNKQYNSSSRKWQKIAVKLSSLYNVSWTFIVILNNQSTDCSTST